MKRRRGFSLVETMMVVAVMGLVLTGATGLTVNMIRGYRNTSVQLDADQTASTALQMISRDLQEAKQVTVVSPTQIRVYYPTLNADGSYNRTVLDSVNTVDYYRGTMSGPNPTAIYMIRKAATGTARVVCKEVTNLTFTSLSASSVDVTLHTERRMGSVTGQCQMIHRAIFLRNY